MSYKISKIKKAYPIRKGVKDKKEWKDSFSRKNGFSILIHKKYWMSIFLHKKLLTPKCNRKSKTLDIKGVIAHCISCVGENWEVRAEPTGKSKAGFIVYTAKGKPVGSGEITVNKKGKIVFSSQALYPKITNSVKFDYKIEGKGTEKDGWEVSGSVTVTDSR